MLRVMFAHLPPCSRRAQVFRHARAHKAVLKCAFARHAVSRQADQLQGICPEGPKGCSFSRKRSGRAAQQRRGAGGGSPDADSAAGMAPVARIRRPALGIVARGSRGGLREVAAAAGRAAVEIRPRRPPASGRAREQGAWQKEATPSVSAAIAIACGCGGASLAAEVHGAAGPGEPRGIAPGHESANRRHLAALSEQLRGEVGGSAKGGMRPAGPLPMNLGFKYWSRPRTLKDIQRVTDDALLHPYL